MSKTAPSGFVRRLRALALGALVGLLASAAGATGTISFDMAPTADPSDAGFTHGVGISFAMAQATGLDFVSIASGPFTILIEDADGNATPDSPLLVDKRLLSRSVTSRTDPATAVERWTLENNTGFEQPGTLVLAFERPISNSVDVAGTLEEFQYALGEVSLDLDNGFDWMILQIPDAGSGETWYFPAVRLGPLALDGIAALELDMTLDNPRIFPEMANPATDEFDLGLPRWQVQAYYIVPEPSTALLLGLGCAALAVRPPRRS